MFGFVKKVICAITIFSSNVLNVNFLECISINNQECKAIPKIIDLNSNEPVFYPYSNKVNKCSRSCRSINDPCAKLCVAYIVKNINFKVFNLMSRINETRHMIWHETCKCVCRLTSSVCNIRQIWSEDKCRCERKELVDKGICDKGFIWNPSNCECKYDKSCGVGEYLNYKNCVCRNSIVDRLVEECTNVIDENKIYNETLYKIPSDDCTSCTLYAVLLAVFLTRSAITGYSFVYFYWHKKISSYI